LETDDAGHAPFVHDDIVQNQRLNPAALGAFAADGALQRESWLRRVGTAHDGIDRPVERLVPGGRQKTDAAQIEAQNRRVGAVQESSAAEQRAVPPQRDEEVQLGGRSFAQERRRATVSGRPECLDALLAVERDSYARRFVLERREESTEVRIVGVPDDPDVHCVVSDSSAARARMRAAIPAPVRPTSASCCARGACSYVRSGTPSATTRTSGAVVCTSAASAAPKPFTTVPSSTVTSSL